MAGELSAAVQRLDHGRLATTADRYVERKKSCDGERLDLLVCSWGEAPRAVLRDLYGSCLDLIMDQLASGYLPYTASQCDFRATSDGEPGRHTIIVTVRDAGARAKALVWLDSLCGSEVDGGCRAAYLDVKFVPGSVC